MRTRTRIADEQDADKQLEAALIAMERSLTASTDEELKADAETFMNDDLKTHADQQAQQDLATAKQSEAFPIDINLGSANGGQNAKAQANWPLSEGEAVEVAKELVSAAKMCHAGDKVAAAQKLVRIAKNLISG